LIYQQKAGDFGLKITNYGIPISYFGKCHI